MLKEGGKRGMWRGNGINVLKIAPESAFKFMAYEQAKRLIRGSRTKDLTIFERFMAGSLAGGFSQSLIYPLEVCYFINFIIRIIFMVFFLGFKNKISH
jgi:solute carrier family 25 (mitochondrial phosphate transporter), member 23/24/25/41